MNISVVIPNYNGKRLLENNLPLILTMLKDKEIIVVDDASTDGSVELIKKLFPTVRLLEHKSNYGFSTTVNDGVKVAKGQWVVLLNSDVVPQKNFLEYLCNHLNDPKVFAVGCLQYGIDWKDHHILGRGIGKFHQGLLVHAPGSLDKHNTLWGFGGAGIFNKKIWEILGGLDTIYEPFYWEDIDLSYRALKAGYKLLFESKSVVKHFHNKGAISTGFSDSYVKKISYRNQIMFVWLNITDPKYLTEHLVYLPFHLMKAVITHDLSYLTGFCLALIKLPEVIKGRLIKRNSSKISDQQVLKQFAGEI